MPLWSRMQLEARLWRPEMTGWPPRFLFVMSAVGPQRGWWPAAGASGYRVLRPPIGVGSVLQGSTRQSRERETDFEA
jgi:hypothetical protein